MSLSRRKRRTVTTPQDSLPSVIELEGMLRFADIGFKATQSHRGWLIIYLQTIEILLQKIAYKLGVTPTKSHKLQVVYGEIQLSRYAEWFYNTSSVGLDQVNLSLILQSNFVATRYISGLGSLSVKVPLRYIQRFARNLMSIANDLRIR